MTDKLLYEACYKKKGSGKLKWFSVTAESEKEALSLLDSHVGINYNQYRRYGGPFLVKPANTIGDPVTQSTNQ